MNTLLNWPSGRAPSLGTLISIVAGNVVCMGIWLHLWVIPDFPLPGRPIAVLEMIHLAAIALCLHGILAGKAQASVSRAKEMSSRFDHLLAPEPAARLGLVVERVRDANRKAGHRPWIGNAAKGNAKTKDREAAVAEVLSEYLAD